MKPKVSFRVFGDSGPVTIYWHEGPYGDAVECRKGDGVCWLSSNGDLLGVEFDDVALDGDRQALVTPTGIQVEVTTKDGKLRIRRIPVRAKNQKAA